MDQITDTINEVLLLKNAVGVSASECANPVLAVIQAAVNASCNCGGNPPGPAACPACEVWHRINS